MIAKITSPDQAEKLLRKLIEQEEQTLVFDLEPSLKLHEIPCTIRRCAQGCDYEYIGWNIWGAGFEKRAVFCQKCGFAMDSLIDVDIVIQGGSVLLLSWRETRTNFLYNHGSLYMKINKLASGSSGNCYKINSDLLIEAGIPINQIEKKGGYKLHEIAACLLSHRSRTF